MNDFPFFQDQTNVHSLAHSMKAKTGAPTPRTRHVPGLRGSTAAPRQKHPSSPLQPVTSLTLNQPCSQQHLLSPPVPARWQKSDTVPSGKTERRKANPPMNAWNQWVSRPPPPPHTQSNVHWSFRSPVSCCRTTTGWSKQTRHYAWSWGRQSGRWTCWRRCWRGTPYTLWRRTPLDRHTRHIWRPLEGWCCPLMAGFINLKLTYITSRAGWSHLASQSAMGPNGTKFLSMFL